MSGNRRYIFNIFILAAAIIWPLFQSLYLNGFDGLGRVQIALSIMAIVINGKRLFDTPKVVHVWLLWIVYCTINTYMKGFNYNNIPLFLWVHNRLLFPYIIMLVAYQAVSYNTKKTFYYLFVCYLIYSILGAIEISAIESYDVGRRYSNELGNTFFNTMIILTTFSSLLYIAKRIKLIPFVIVLAFVTYMLILSGERKGLIALIIIITGIYIAINSDKKALNIISYSFFAVVAYVALNYIMDNTTFGDRMTNTLENSEFKDNWFLWIMGDRAIQYYDGWHYFLQSPWTGIGLRKYAEINTYWTDGGGVFHTEYMAQLTECGIIGSIMFLIFYYGMIIRLFSPIKKMNNRAMIIVLRASLIAIIVINFVAWTYDIPNYFMLFGIIYAFCERERALQKNKNLVNINSTL